MTQEIIKAVRLIRNLNHINRCARFPVLRPTTVAEHSYHVVVWALALAEERTTRCTEHINIETVLRKAVLHDVEESVLSDIPYDVKKFIGNANESLGILVRECFRDTPDWMRNSLGRQTDDTSLEWCIVKMADYIELGEYCYAEVRMGNIHLRSILLEVIKLLTERNIRADSDITRSLLRGYQECYDAH